MSAPDEREQMFRRLYAEHFDRVLGFTLRRVDRPEDAADATAEVFLVAWRRLSHVPPGPEARLWLYGVARRMLANQRRGETRRTALGRRLRQQLPAAVLDCSEEVVVRADVAAALRDLSGRDQEVLELHLYEGLESREIAEVLGLSTVVVRPRLSRARARLRALLERNASEEPGHRPAQEPLLAPKEEA